MMRQRLLKFSSILLFVIVFGATVGQGIVSSYRLYPSALPGYWVQPFDSTIMWAGTRALFLQGISPYSPAGDGMLHRVLPGKAYWMPAVGILLGWVIQSTVSNYDTRILGYLCEINQ
jgi:hypothetical protein